ncbi:MAG: glycosyltransferase [Suilimivivens sp.]
MEKQIHIAMLIGALTKGGSERVLVNLADYFAEKGYRVTMVTQYRKENEYSLNPKVYRVISDITEKETTKNRVVNFKRRFFKLRNIWKKEKPDIILSFIGKNNMMAILTSRFLKIPVAVSVRGEPTEEYYNSWMRFMAKHLFTWADGVILQTKRCMDFFPEKVQKKAVILKNPVNQSFFRERYEGERDKTIVAVGRVDENKNHEMIIRAFAQIAEEFPEYKLIIYGDGESRSKLIQLTHELKLQDRVLLPGSIDDVADTIYKAGVFVLSSNTEGVPNTLIEAMLMGLTVVATDCPCGGPADLIQTGYNGILTPVKDVEKMRENLHFLLKNLQNADELGKNAIKTADIFRPEKIYGSWETFLMSLCAGGSK